MAALPFVVQPFPIRVYGVDKYITYMYLFIIGIIMIVVDRSFSTIMIS